MPRLILHVDDDPNLPEGVVAVLEADGYVWERTADPEHAMRQVETRDVALVLIEIDLPGCDGIDLLAGMLVARGDLPVLVLTRHPRDSAMHGEVIALGISDFLSKPVLRGQLLAAIREVARPALERPAEPAASAPTAKPGADLSGAIAETPVPELLARLRRRGAGGVLKLVRDGAVVGVQLRNGTPICVGTNRRRDADAQREDAAEAWLFEAFGWEHGSWEFVEGRRLPADASAELSGDPADLMLRGVLAALPVAWVRDRLRKRATLYVSASGRCDEHVPEATLSRKQVAVLRGLAGHDSLGDLLDSMEFEERVLYGLWIAGWIDLHAVPTLDLTDLHGTDPHAPTQQIEHVRVHERVRPGAGREPAAPAPPRAAPLRPARPSAAGASLPREEASQALRELAQQVMTGDDFEVLGVDVDVSESALEDARSRLLAAIPPISADATDFDLRARADRIRDRIESAYAHLSDPESRRAYALLRSEERQDREAGSAAERALEGERWFRKGRGCLEGRRYEEAAEAFGMASHLDPNEGEYLAHLGYALFLSKPGNKVVQREAMEHVANGIKRSPNREMSHVYLGRILKARGEEDAAYKIFRRALRIRPDSHAALQEIRLLEMRKRKGRSKGLLSRLLGE